MQAAGNDTTRRKFDEIYGSHNIRRAIRTTVSFQSLSDWDLSSHNNSITICQITKVDIPALQEMNFTEVV